MNTNTHSKDENNFIVDPVSKDEYLEAVQRIALRGVKPTKKLEVQNIKSNISLQKQIDLLEARIDELDHYRKQFKNLDDILKVTNQCNSCCCHLSTDSKHENLICTHPLLLITQCSVCNDFYTSGEFEHGEDGSELYCRWCGQGGEVYCCAECIFVFCKACIKRNFPKECMRDVLKNENWKCFACVPEYTTALRSRHWALLKYVERQKNGDNNKRSSSETVQSEKTVSGRRRTQSATEKNTISIKKEILEEISQPLAPVEDNLHAEPVAADNSLLSMPPVLNAGPPVVSQPNVLPGNIVPQRFPLSLNPLAVLQAAVNEAPFLQGPVHRVPMHNATVRQAPVHRAPMQRATSRPALVHQHAIRQQQVNQTHMRQAPMHQMTVYQPSVHQSPVHQSPVHQPPVNQSPVHQSPIHQTSVHQSPGHQPIGNQPPVHQQTAMQQTAMQQPAMQQPAMQPRFPPQAWYSPSTPPHVNNNSGTPTYRMSYYPRNVMPTMRFTQQMPQRSEMLQLNAAQRNNTHVRLPNGHILDLNRLIRNNINLRGQTLQNNAIQQNNTIQQSNTIQQNNAIQQNNTIQQNNAIQQNNGIQQNNTIQQNNAILQNNAMLQSMLLARHQPPPLISGNSPREQTPPAQQPSQPPSQQPPQQPPEAELDLPTTMARTRLDLHLNNAMEVCQHITHKMRKFPTSQAYQQSRSTNDIIQLNLHLAYLLDYTVERFQSLQKKCVEDTKHLTKSLKTSTDEVEIIEPVRPVINVDEDDEAPVLKRNPLAIKRQLDSPLTIDTSNKRIPPQQRGPGGPAGDMYSNNVLHLNHNSM